MCQLQSRSISFRKQFEGYKTDTGIIVIFPSVGNLFQGGDFFNFPKMYLLFLFIAGVKLKFSSWVRPKIFDVKIPFLHLCLSVRACHTSFKSTANVVSTIIGSSTGLLSCIPFFWSQWTNLFSVHPTYNSGYCFTNVD
jgi:hypothetical protein